MSETTAQTRSNSVPTNHTPEARPTESVQSADSLAESTASVVERVDEALDNLTEIESLLQLDDDYTPATRDYEVPDEFRLTVVVPVYNEEDTLTAILGRVVAIPLPKQIVIVDDCSTDRSREILEQLRDHPDIDLVFKERNAGKGAALRTGFEHATGDVVVVQDADMEYDPRDIASLVKPIVAGETDVVYGSRFLSNAHQDPSFLHRLINHILTWSANVLNRTRLTDMETCYKVFRREVIQSIDLKQDRFGFEPEVTAKLSRRGHKILELPIHYNARPFSEGKKIGLKDVFEAFYCIARYGIAD